MALAHLGNFAVTRAWKWEDIDDAGLVAFLVADAWHNSGDYSVDRSGPQPLLRWQVYRNEYPNPVPTGVWHQAPLALGDYVLAITASAPYEPTVGKLPGRWAADEFGRPANVNDLAAPPPTP